MGCISMFRHCDWAARFPGEEVDEPGGGGQMESQVEGPEAEHPGSRGMGWS